MAGGARHRDLVAQRGVVNLDASCLPIRLATLRAQRGRLLLVCSLYQFKQTLVIHSFGHYKFNLITIRCYFHFAHGVLGFWGIKFLF